MKTALLFAAGVIAAIFPLCAPPARALAEGEITGRYACAAAGDIYFCESKDLNSAKFVIPYMYCVQLLGEEGDWYSVRYAEETQYYRPLYGWCLKENLRALSSAPARAFLNMPVTVTIKVDLPSETLPALAETVTVAYYGEYYSGAVPLSCVLYKNEFFYVPQTFEYPPSDIVLEQPAPEPSGGGGANVKLICAVALSALAVGALTVLYFANRRKLSAPPHAD